MKVASGGVRRTFHFSKNLIVASEAQSEIRPLANCPHDLSVGVEGDQGLFSARRSRVPPLLDLFFAKAFHWSIVNAFSKITLLRKDLLGFAKRLSDGVALPSLDGINAKAVSAFGDTLAFILGLLS
jgi:hypothetical protein